MMTLKEDILSIMKVIEIQNGTEIPGVIERIGAFIQELREKIPNQDLCEYAAQMKLINDLSGFE